MLLLQLFFSPFVEGHNGLMLFFRYILTGTLLLSRISRCSWRWMSEYFQQPSKHYHETILENNCEGKSAARNSNVSQTAMLSKTKKEKSHRALAQNIARDYNNIKPRKTKKKTE